MNEEDILRGISDDDSSDQIISVLIDIRELTKKMISNQRKILELLDEMGE